MQCNCFFSILFCHLYYTFYIVKTINAMAAYHSSWRIYGWPVFLIVCGFYLIFTIIADWFVLNDAVYYRSLAEQLSADRIASYLSLREQYAWIGYLALPLAITAKSAYTAFFLASGAVVAEHEDIDFKQCFKAAILCEGVFVAAQGIRLLWAGVVGIETLEDYTSMQILSLMSLFKGGDIEPWLASLLQTINVFEALYCTSLCWVMALQSNRSLGESARFVLPAYGMGLLLWLSIVMFLALQFNPA